METGALLRHGGGINIQQSNGRCSVITWARLPLKADMRELAPVCPLRLPAQPVDATQALNFSAGVSNPRVLRGRSLSWRATLLRWACEYTDKSASLETSAAEACHDGLADGRSAPTVLSVQPRTAHSGEPSPAPDQSDCNAGAG